MINEYDFVEYFKIDIPDSLDLKNKQAVISFCDDLILNIQGVSVEIPETKNLALLLLSFSLVKKYAQAAFFLNSSGERFSLFDYYLAPTINSEPAKVIISEEELAVEAKNIVLDQIEYNLEEIWQENSSSDFIEKLKLSLATLKNQVQNSRCTTIIGIVPPLFLIFSFMMLNNLSGEIYYQESSSSAVIKIN